jgi:hypothetical protein
MRDGSRAIYGATPVQDGARFRSDDPWIRWTATAEAVYAIVDPDRDDWLEIPDLPREVDRASVAEQADARLRLPGRGVAIKPPLGSRDGMPVVLEFARSG